MYERTNNSIFMHCFVHVLWEIVTVKEINFEEKQMYTKIHEAFKLNANILVSYKGINWLPAGW